VDGIVEQEGRIQQCGGKTMEIDIDSHGEALAPARSVGPALSKALLRVRPRLLGRRARAFLHLGERGSAVVEFALILPMLLLLTTGLLVFGVAMNNYLQLTNAVSVGARTLAINASMTKDPCSVGSSAITSAAPALDPTKFTFSFTLNGTAYNNQSSCSSASTSTGAAGNLASGTVVSVTATYPLNLSVFGKVFSQSNAVLSATSTELVQ
jgi:Flp pilus assembly protein TadG